MKDLLLQPLAGLFGVVVRSRHALYKRGWRQSQDLQSPTISVGNITVGGTGKTPLVVFIAKLLAENGRKPVVLTRGYKRENPNKPVLVSDGNTIFADARKAGDEPFESARKLLGTAAVIADKNRFAAGMRAKENLACDAFILDDGFQHLQLKRHLDIVAIDATNPFGNGQLFPAGTLREPLKNLQRADLIIVTRADLVADISDLKKRIAVFNATAPIISAKTEIMQIRSLEDFSSGINRNSEVRHRKSFAFCGLGNPENFYRGLRRKGFQITGVKSFPDHHFYSSQDISAIESAAAKAGAEILLTTAKDAVKFGHSSFTMPCSVVEIEAVFDDEKTIRKMVAEILF